MFYDISIMPDLFMPQKTFCENNMSLRTLGKYCISYAILANLRDGEWLKSIMDKNAGQQEQESVNKIKLKLIKAMVKSGRLYQRKTEKGSLDENGWIYEAIASHKNYRNFDKIITLKGSNWKGYEGIIESLEIFNSARQIDFFKSSKKILLNKKNIEMELNKFFIGCKTAYYFNPYGYSYVREDYRQFLIIVLKSFFYSGGNELYLECNFSKISKEYQSLKTILSNCKTLHQSKDIYLEI